VARPVVRIGRIYDKPSPEDGTRVLVDRLWPRGLAKDAAAIDEWAKAAAPSDELRRWYRHEPRKFAEFRRRYGDEFLEPDRAPGAAASPGTGCIRPDHVADRH
jgi:uncharacterized protein YeaO (DUF488 family)